jgi:hypothetical protein
MTGATNRSIPEPFSILASKKDIEAALKDLREQKARIRVDDIADSDLVYIGTIWSCLNHLQKTCLSKNQVAELIAAYLGFDEVAAWYRDCKGDGSKATSHGTS